MTETAPTLATSLPPLNDDLRAILGRPNFACARFANDLRGVGFEIEHKAEHEQAAVLHYMLGFYLSHGASWADACANDMERRFGETTAKMRQCISEVTEKLKPAAAGDAS